MQGSGFYGAASWVPAACLPLSGGPGWGWVDGRWDEGSKVSASLLRWGHLTSAGNVKFLEFSLYSSSRFDFFGVVLSHILKKKKKAISKIRLMNGAVS